jgi:hypothetical protein
VLTLPRISFQRLGGSSADRIRRPNIGLQPTAAGVIMCRCG